MMATRLTKPVSRVSNETVRDTGKFRQLVITIDPAGLIELRPQGTRRAETYPIEALYYLALKTRVNAERAAKRAAKGKK